MLDLLLARVSEEETWPPSGTGRDSVAYWTASVLPACFTVPLGPLQRGGGQADQRKSFQHPQTRSPAPLPRGKALVRRPVPALSPGRRGSLPRLTSLPGTARRPPAFPPEQANPASRGAHQRSPPYSSPRPPSPEEGNPPHATPRHHETGTAEARPWQTRLRAGAGPPPVAPRRRKRRRRLFTSGFGGGSGPDPTRGALSASPRRRRQGKGAPRRRPWSRGAGRRRPRHPHPPCEHPPPRTCAGARGACGRFAVHRGGSHVRPGPGGRPPLPPQLPPVSAGGAGGERPPPAGPGRGGGRQARDGGGRDEDEEGGGDTDTQGTSAGLSSSGGGGHGKIPWLVTALGDKVPDEATRCNPRVGCGGSRLAGARRVSHSGGLGHPERQ